MSIVLSLAIVFGITTISRETVLADTVDSSGLTYTYTNTGVATITGFMAPTGFDGFLEIPATLGVYTVTSIGDYAFNNCTSLTDITIPEGVTSIGNDAFRACYNLTGITIPSSVTSIGGSAFYNCSSLTGITIPSGVTSIGDWAFFNCSSLTDITIPSSMTSIGAYTFYNCSSLTGITIPVSVMSIGDWAFNNCSSLADITIPSSVTSIGDSAFRACYNLADITIPSGVTSIGAYTFYSCSSLTGITIPSGVTSIGDYAFDYCISLTGITIPDSVTSIGNSAFNYCSSLTGITIPSSVATIGDAAFSVCSNLADAYFYGNAPSMGTDVFANTRPGFTVYYLAVNTGFANPWQGYSAATFEIAVTGVSLNTSATNISVGGSAQLTETVAPENAGIKDVIWSVYSESGTNIVTVSALGLVSANTVGTAVIRATSAADETKYADCTVTVLDAILIYAWNDEFKGLIDKYYVADNAGFAYNYQITENTTYQTQLDAVLASGDGAPDIYLVEADYAKKYVNSDNSLDISELGIDYAELADQYAYTYEYMMDYSGAVKALSWQACPSGIFYNRSLATTYLGSDDPAMVQESFATWDAFIAMAQQINIDSAGAVKAISGYDDIWRSFSNSRATGWIVDGVIHIDPVMDTYLDYAKQLTDEGLTFETAQWDESWNANMANQSVLSYWGPMWLAQYCMGFNYNGDGVTPAEGSNPTTGDWGFCAAPEPYYWGGTWIVASQYDNFIETTADIMRYFTIDDTSMSQMVADGQYVNNKSVMTAVGEDPDFGLAMLGGQNPFGLMNDIAGDIDVSVATGYDVEINTIFAEIVDEYVRGDIETIAEAKAAFISDCNDAGIAQQYTMTTEYYTITYGISEGEAVITGFTALDGFDGNLEIPDTLGGVSVTSIGDNAFYACEDLVCVTIKGAVTSIGDSAFNIGAGMQIKFIVPADKIAYYQSLLNADVMGGTTAVVTDKYTVHFDTNGGIEGAGSDYTQYIGIDGLASAPANPPTRIGYSFGGWYEEASCSNVWDFGADKVTNDMTLYAKWIAIPIPATPTGLKAVSAGYNSNKLTWTAVTGATGYSLYRSTSPTSGFTYIKTVTSVTYTNTGLTTGTTYYYQIKAYTLVDTTKIYSAATAAVSAKPIPATPTGLKAVSAGYNSNKLTWTAVAGATGYSLYRSTSPTSGFTYIKTVTSATYTNTGLTTGTTYYYKIEAYTMVGTTKIYSAFTSVVSAKPIPATPTGLTAARASATSIKISWNAVTGATGYAMYRSTSSTSGFTYVKTVTSASYTNTGLTTGTTYYYQIKAYTTVGTTKIFSTATAAVGAKP